MGPTWVLSAQDGPHIGPMKLAIRVALLFHYLIKAQRAPYDIHQEVKIHQAL